MGQLNSKDEVAMPVTLRAEPEPLAIELSKTAIIVVDMQNAFVSPGGMFDLWGHDISPAQKITPLVKRICTSARPRVGKVVYTKAQYSTDMHETGGPNSPSWYKNKNLVTYREHPDLRDRLTLRGTWGADIIKELEPQEGDVVVEKQKYSAFFGTNLDITLRTYNIKYLVFVGVATNICVESTLRDASFYEYWPILISDACASDGHELTQEATITNVKLHFGWVTTTEGFLRAIE